LRRSPMRQSRSGKLRAHRPAGCSAARDPSPAVSASLFGCWGAHSRSPGAIG
jgi:hypothetical protein